MKKEGLTQTILIAGVGLVSGLVGSSFQQYLSVSLEQQKMFDSWRREAYIYYLSSLEKRRLSEDEEAAAGKSYANSDEQKRHNENAAKLRAEWEYEASTGAKKIGVFGNTAVVKAIARHWQDNFEIQPCSKDWRTDLAIFRVMREQATPNEPNVTDEDLAQVMLRCTPQNQ